MRFCVRGDCLWQHCLGNRCLTAIIKISSTEQEPLPTENSQDPNNSETSNCLESETTPEQNCVEPTQQPGSEPTQPGVELINPHTLISRQTPSEMSGSKIKRLRKKISEKGFDPEQPIEVADVDGRLIILDGHHRGAAARQLGIKRVD